MGTRAVITFIDEFGRHSVYQHWDGDYETVLDNIRKTIRSGKCWKWPRWEADEFAAAYVATVKTDSGNIRLSRGVAGHGGLSFSYTVQKEGKDGEEALRIATRSGSKLLSVRWIVFTDTMTATIEEEV